MKPNKKEKRVKKKELDELKHQARRKSIQEGIFASAEVAFGDHFISPFAIAINASNSLVALFGSIGGLLGPLTQLFSSRLIEKHPRKKIVLNAVFLEALFWIPFVLIAVLFSMGIGIPILPLALILVFSIHVIIRNIGGPAWFSWIGDIVDEGYRGRWTAKRALIHGITVTTLALTAAFFLDYFKKVDMTMIGFMIFFGLACILRFLSWKHIREQYEPKIKLEKGYYFSFYQFISKAPKNNFGRFAIYRSLLAFATSVIGPLVAVYLLRNLQLSYSIYTVITLAGGIVSLMIIGLWGKLSDRFGNYHIMLLTSFITPVIPILWIISKNPLYLTLFPSVIGSIAWAGFGLASGNYIYDNVSHEKRGLAVSYYNMVVGIGVFLGAGLGAILIKYLNTTWIEPLILIFIISGILRMLVVISMMPLLKEVRKKEKLPGTRALGHIILKEAKPTIIEDVHQLMSIKGYMFDKGGKS